MKENLDFQRIQTAWTRYVAGPESVPEQIPGVRPEIVDSWRRSKGQAGPFALEKTFPQTTSRHWSKTMLSLSALPVHI